MPMKPKRRMIPIFDHSRSVRRKYRMMTAPMKAYRMSRNFPCLPR
jgi:hypothetical protein